MVKTKRSPIRRLSLRHHRATKLQVVLLVAVVVAVGGALVYRSFAGSNAQYVPRGVSNLQGYGKMVRVNSAMTGGYALDGHGRLFPFSVGTTTIKPAELPTGDYYSTADVARDFIMVDWSKPAAIVLSNDGQLHNVGGAYDITVEPISTKTARHIMMYDDRRGYILDGAGHFIRFSLNGVSLPPAIGGFTVRSGQDFYRNATLNPNKQSGYLVGSDGNVYEFHTGSNANALPVSATTTWPGVNKAISIVMSDWKSRQGYVIGTDGGWYAFNGAPNDYTRKSGAPFNFGTDIRGFDILTGKAGFEINKDGTIYVFSLPNFLVAQNDKEIYPPAPSKPFTLGPRLAYGYYRMPNAPNGEYEFYNPKQSPFNRQSTPDVKGTLVSERCGRAELLNLVYSVSKKWQDTYGKDGSRINVGDMNADGHISHRNGVDVDLRTSNLSAFNVANAQRYTYLRSRSIQTAKWLIDGGAKLLLYNDTAIFAQVNAYGRSKGLNYDVMQYYTDHNEHIHVRIGNKSVSNNPLNLTTTTGCP